MCATTSPPSSNSGEILQVIQTKENVVIYAPSTKGGLRQCELISGLRLHKLDPSTFDKERPDINVETHPLAIVMSQDCDLESDWRIRSTKEQNKDHNKLPFTLLCEVTTKIWRRKSLPETLKNILLCPISTAYDIRHRTGMNSTLWEGVPDNKDERFQFLEIVPPHCDAENAGFPELGIDFKRYFTIPTDELYLQLQSTAKRRCRLLSPYLEQLSSRFAYFQGRVALPRDHDSIKEKSKGSATVIPQLTPPTSDK